MSIMHPVIAARRLVARRPVVYWILVAACAAVAVAAVAAEVRQLRTERERWGTTANVLVAAGDAAPGDPLDVRQAELPVALAPPGAARQLDGRIARRHVRAGDIVGEIDLTGAPGPLALVPDGWRAVPVVESPPSAAMVADRVDVVSDGIVVVAEAVVVGSHDGVTLVAVPADAAPLVALATSTGSVTLLRLP